MIGPTPRSRARKSGFTLSRGHARGPHYDVWVVTSPAAASTPEPHLPRPSLEDISRRLDRLRRIVYVSGRPTAEEVDAVFRDVAMLSRTDGSIPAWKIREIDEDVSRLAEYRSRSTAVPSPRAPEPVSPRRAKRRRPAALPGRAPAAELTPVVDLIRRATTLVNGAESGAAATPERARSVLEELRVAKNIAGSRRDPVVTTLESLHGRLARVRRRVEARHRTAPRPDSSTSPSPSPGAKKARTLRAFIPVLSRPVKAQRARRTDAQRAHGLREQALLLARAMEHGHEVPQARITDVLYRFAADRQGRASSADLRADRKAVQRLEAADREARKRTARDR